MLRWCQRVRAGLAAHGGSDLYVEAKQRSGNTKGTSGVTPAQEMARSEWKKAEANAYQARRLSQEASAAENGAAEACGKGKAPPRLLWNMQQWEQSMVKHHRDGGYDKELCWAKDYTAGEKARPAHFRI